MQKKRLFLVQIVDHNFFRWLVLPSLAYYWALIFAFLHQLLVKLAGNISCILSNFWLSKLHYLFIKILILYLSNITYICVFFSLGSFQFWYFVDSALWWTVQKSTFHYSICYRIQRWLSEKHHWCSRLCLKYQSRICWKWCICSW